MLHPVGDLPAAVYWRRRVLVLALLLALFGGGGWVGWAVATGRADRAGATPPGTTDIAATASGLTPPATTPAGTATTTAAPGRPAAATTRAVPPSGNPCADAVLRVAVRAPAGAPVGGKPTFELAVANTSSVPCVRDLDKGRQEIVLLDATGARVWGSNDCFPETARDRRTLAPGEVVGFPVLWSGLRSEPSCTAPRTPPPPGAYVIRGRLDAVVSPDAPLTIG